MKKDYWIDSVGFAAVKILGIFFRNIPLGLSLWIGRRIGDLSIFVNSKRWRIAYTNLKAAFPEKEPCEIKLITRRSFQNLGMNLIEVFRIPKLNLAYIDRFIKFENLEFLNNSLASKKGLVLLTAHFGNWELSSIFGSLKGYKVCVFAREQKYSRLNELLNKYRALTGCIVIQKGISTREVLKRLKKNEIVGMLLDQDAGESGEFIDFFGRPASTPLGPISFAMKTGSKIVPAFIIRDKGFRHIIEIERPIELDPAKTKEENIRIALIEFNNLLESYIRRYPEQWLWAHKRWKSSPQRSILVLSDQKAGHLNQSMAVAEMVEETLSSRLKAKTLVSIVEVRFKNRLSRFLLNTFSLISMRGCQGCLICLKKFLTKESYRNLKNRYADIIISCGSSLAGLNLILKRENNAKSIVVMNPGFLPKRLFNLIISPRHDGLKEGGNILITEGAPNRIRDEAIKKGIEILEGHGSWVMGHGGIGLLVGGDTKDFRLLRRDVEAVSEGVLRISEEYNRDIFITTSRRTSKEIEEVIKKKFSSFTHCKLLIIANDKNIEGAVPGIFGLSEVVILSPESISMISEAASSGRYAVVFMAQGSRLKAQGKYERFLRNFEDKGYIRIARPDEIYGAVKQILKERPKNEVLNDRAKIIERLKGFV